MKYIKKFIFLFITCIIVLFSFIITNINLYKSKYSGNENTISGIIYEYSIDGNKLTMHIKSKEKLICKYYFNTEKEKQYYLKNIKLGYEVKLKGNLLEPNNNTVPNLFNYKRYLCNNRIYWIFIVDKINIISKKSNIFYKIKNNIIDKIDTYKFSKNYLYAFILGDTSKIDINIIKSYQNNGISHLFAVSGMHITLLTGIIILILKKIRIGNIFINIIVFTFLLLYIFLTGFSASILRASLFFILIKINGILNLKIKTINILLLTISFLLIINPFLIYNLGFQYSCIVSLTIVYFSDLINKNKLYIFKILNISIIAFLAGLPISIYNFYNVNLLSILLNLVFVPFISLIMFPFSILTFIFPILDKINGNLIIILENLSLFTNNFKLFNIILAKPNLIIVFLYYIIIIFSLVMFNKRKFKYIGLIIIILFIHNNYKYFNSKLEMIMIDVGQGDSILISLPNNSSNILIDTGGQIKYKKESWKITNSNYSIAKDTLIPFFRSLGVKKIDYLIITHGDSDHMGEAINLVNNFKVENIIFNCGEYNDLEKELINILEKKNIKHYSCIKELNMDKYKLQFLNTKEYDNENDNSNVVYFNYNNYKFLFMGDAGIDREKDILDKYNINNIDFLKVGHHGSNTSSSNDFIESINPKYSLISVGKNNRYGHPKDEVLDTLSNSKIYRTDINGSVEIKLDKNSYKFRTYSP